MAVASSIVQDSWRMVDVQHAALSHGKLPVAAGRCCCKPGSVAPQNSIRAAGQAQPYVVVLVEVSSPAQREDLLRLVKNAHGCLPEQHCHKEQRHQQSSLHSAQAQIGASRTLTEQQGNVVRAGWTAVVMPAVPLSTSKGQMQGCCPPKCVAGNIP